MVEARAAAAENGALQRRLEEKERLIVVLQEDLAESRRAHADDIARLTAKTVSPVAAIPRRKAHSRD